ncbi:MAG TPA: hypothetical protein VFZ59_06955 [Verrucomicrobiae bacterium]|nr:hypothetical protein [Verrucomicrobiae bacterium]
MTAFIMRLRGFCLAIGILCVPSSRAADFAVTSPGFYFSFNGTNAVNSFPTLTLVRGRSYTFALNTTAGFHPFAIGTSVFGPAPAGVSGNNNNTSGTITFAVPANAANCVYYCGQHGFTMTGNIVMVDPPAPPTITIVGLKVSTNLTVTSTLASTNGLTIVPEFNTNLPSGNWFPLTVQSNRFANGTNEAFCGRPPGDAVLIRIRAQQN